MADTGIQKTPTPRRHGNESTNHLGNATPRAEGFGNKVPLAGILVDKTATSGQENGQPDVGQSGNKTPRRSRSKRSKSRSPRVTDDEEGGEEVEDQVSLDKLVDGEVTGQVSGSCLLVDLFLLFSIVHNLIVST